MGRCISAHINTNISFLEVGYNRFEISQQQLGSLNAPTPTPPLRSSPELHKYVITQARARVNRRGSYCHESELVCYDSELVIYLPVLGDAKCPALRESRFGFLKKKLIKIGAVYFCSSKCQHIFLENRPRGLSFTWWGCYGLCLT